MSGSNGPQVMAALRFLGLIDGSNRPQPSLERIAEDRAPEPKERKRILWERLRESYAEALQGLDLDRFTPDELREHFGVFGISGDTLRKALTFFIEALEYCGIELSPHIKKPAKGRTRRRARSAKKQPSEEYSPPIATSPDPSGEARLHLSIQGLLDDLLRFGNGWSGEQQDSWLDVFARIIKYAYPARDRQLRMLP